MNIVLIAHYHMFTNYVHKKKTQPKWEKHSKWLHTQLARGQNTARKKKEFIIL
jgi:hypothetical protein